MEEVRRAVSQGSGPLVPLQGALEKLFLRYDGNYLESDPLRYPHRYRDPLDREVVAFLSATFAFGNVPQIFRSLDRILEELGPAPVRKLRAWPKLPPGALLAFRHRWVKGEDLHALLRGLGAVYSHHGSLESFYEKALGRETPELSLRSFADRVRQLWIGKGRGQRRGLSFLVPSAESGGTFKRLNLFLRWVVRSEWPDLGLWTKLTPANLFLPIDTHLARIVRYIGLTRRKTTDFRMVREATQSLRAFDPRDPIRFDFALARLGILDDCRHRWDARICPRCPLESVCLIRQGLPLDS